MLSGGFKDQLKSAFSSVTQSAVHGAKELGKFVQQEALGAQCLLDYTVGAQVASAGSGAPVWRVYAARSKKGEGSPNPLVAAWVLDKRSLTHAEESHGGGSGGALTRPSQRRLELFLEQCRRDVAALARLKHPGVLRLVAPLEETRTQLVFITEPLFASLADLLAGGSGGSGDGSGGGGGGPAALPPQLAQERRQLRLSELEIKHGLLQLADGLHFLHSEAGLVHKGICPASILITQSGAWKLAGFAFSTCLDYRSPDQRAYDYSDAYPSLLQQVTQPPLAYVAPELVASGTSNITGAADVFSLGAVAFELLARRQLLPVGHRLADYESTVHSLTLVDMAGVPVALEHTLRQIVSPVANARPPAAAFAGCQYFQADVLLRALKFLDSMLQRDGMQKAAFLRDLPAMCAQFDARVLQYKVLPPLLQELRDVQLQPVLLPIVLRIVQQQEPTEFADRTLPSLKPLLATASGETLLLLVQNTELLAKCMPAAAAAQVLPPLLVRAAEQGDPRCQEEMLKRVAGLADSLDYEGLKKAVLPAVHALCLRTTSAAVRVGAFAAMSRLVQRVDQAEAEAMLQIAAQVTSVDKSGPTAMCVLALGGALGKQWGPRLTAERVLPALTPLLVAPTLTAQQFGVAVKTVRELVSGIEKARGGAAAAGAAADGGGGGEAAAAGGSDGGRGGKQAAAAAASSDWLAATAVQPAGGGGSSSGGGTASWQAAPSAAAAAARANGDDPLAGLRLQPAAAAGGGRAAARPAAATALAAALTAGSSFGGSGSTYGVAGRKIGSGKPMGTAAAAAPMAAARAEPSRGFPGHASGSSSSSSPGPGMRPGQFDGSGSGMGMGAGSGGGGFASPSYGLNSSSGGTAAAGTTLQDPFAGLQLGGAHSSSSGGGGGSWPAAAGSSSGVAGAAFDPFAPQPSGGAPTGGGALQWPQQQQRRPAGGGFAAGDSLI